jgi:hypothetical protein
MRQRLESPLPCTDRTIMSTASYLEASSTGDRALRAATEPVRTPEGSIQDADELMLCANSEQHARVRQT